MRDPSSTRRRILDSALTLVMDQGFSATTVDAVIDSAGVSKGAFSHHFSSKQALGLAMLERYAEADRALLESFMEVAEASSDDPAEQIIRFVREFEDNAAELFTQPGCLFVSFLYERMPEETRKPGTVIRSNVEMWREALGDKLRAAFAALPLPPPADPDTVADLMFVVFEGSFILARAMGDPDHVHRHLAEYRCYLQMLLGLAGTAPNGSGQ